MLWAVRFEPKPFTSDFDAAIDAFILSRHIKNASAETLQWYHKHLKPFAHF